MAAILLLLPSIAQGQTFEYRVELQRLMRNRQGTLIITSETIEFKSDQVKDSRSWSPRDIEQIKVSSPTSLEITTYEDQKLKLGRDRVFRFRLLQGEITRDVSALLMARATRPIATSILPETTGLPRFEIPVKHLHTFGGCEGVLRIFADRVTYESATRPGDSRYWRYTDIEHIGHPTRFRFELLSFENEFAGPTKNFNFELKEDLPMRVYDYVWVRLNPSDFYPQLKLDTGENK
jgi:hypothetical protein